MCLAVPARIETIEGSKGAANLSGNTIEVQLDLVPEAKIGDWILIHAGFAIALLDEDEARETFDILSSQNE